MFSGASTAPRIRAGKLRGLAAIGAACSPLFPDLPTIGEFYPGYLLSTWLGIFSPAGVPDAVMARLRGDINKALALPEVRERFNASGGLQRWAATPRSVLSGLPRITKSTAIW